MAKGLRFLFIEGLVAALAVLSAVAVFRLISPEVPRPMAAVNETLPAGIYISSPGENPLYSRMALKTQLQRGELIVLGSSELTQKSEVALQTFFPQACGKRVLAIGRAGFQNLSIFLTLARVREDLGPKSKIVIILSPVWFSERATASDAFLRELEPYGIASLIQAGPPNDLRSAIAREIRTRGDEFSGLYPDWLMNRFPILANLSRPRGLIADPVKIEVQEAQLSKGFDWNAAEEKWKTVQKELAAGNPLGTSLEYYDRVKKKNPPFPAKRLDIRETEKQDLYALSRFLREHNVHAHFVLQPIHRRLYNQLESYDRLFEEVEDRLRNDGHTWQSYFTEPFDLNTLHDSAHFSQYTWVHLQRELCAR